MENLIFKNLLMGQTDLLMDHSEMIRALLVADILFIAAVAFFVVGMFVRKKLFYSLSFLSFLGYFYVNIAHLNTEFLWLVITLMGVLMFTLEALVPGVQVFGFVGLAFLSLGIANSGGSVGLSIFVISLAILISMLIIYLFTRAGYRIKAFDKFVLEDKISSRASGGDKKSSLVGKSGLTSSALRPTGKGEIDGEIYDLYSEEGMIPENTRVIVVRQEAMKIIVRRIK